MKNALKTKGRPNQSRRHEGALVGLDPQTKLQAPRRVARGAIAPLPNSESSTSNFHVN